MSINHAAQEFPRAATAVHPHHPEDLEEAKAPEGARREHLSAAPHREHDDARDYCYHIWKQSHVFISLLKSLWRLVVGAMKSISSVFPELAII